jgi:hypothetical protein
VAERFRERGEEVVGWFFNPNIHPEAERARREAVLGEAARASGLELLPAGPDLSFADFLLELARRGGPRCRACYGMRLEEGAREAARQGCAGFSTTLLISPYQDIEAIGEAGRAAGARAGVSFAYVDLRGEYEDGRERARELHLYQQNYCGCTFSALERAERRAKRAIGKALKSAS